MTLVRRPEIPSRIEHGFRFGGEIIKLRFELLATSLLLRPCRYDVEEKGMRSEICERCGKKGSETFEGESVKESLCSESREGEEVENTGRYRVLT